MIKEHVWFKCPPECEKRSCNFCEGGLSLCTVCGAGEAELLSACPGFKLSAEALEACLDGTVVDLEWERLSRELPPLEK